MRRENDAYFTHESMVDALVHHTKVRGTILEPCCGTGVISNELTKRGMNVITNDISLQYGAHHYEDATTFDGWKSILKESPKIDWVVTNPPFNKAFEILKLAFPNIPNVAFLLRLSFLEPTYARQEYLEVNPPNKLIVLPRHSFTENGKTDSVTCAWMIWSLDDYDNKIAVWPKKGKLK